MSTRQATEVTLSEWESVFGSIFDTGTLSGERRGGRIKSLSGAAQNY